MTRTTRLAFATLCTGMVAMSTAKMISVGGMLSDSGRVARMCSSPMDLFSAVVGLMALVGCVMTRGDVGGVMMAVVHAMLLADWVSLLLAAKSFGGDYWHIGERLREIEDSDRGASITAPADDQTVASFEAAYRLIRALLPRAWTISFVSSYLVHNFLKSGHVRGRGSLEVSLKSKGMEALHRPLCLNDSLIVRQDVREREDGKQGGQCQVGPSLSQEAELMYVKEATKSIETTRAILPLPYQLPSLIGYMAMMGLSQSCEVYARHAAHALSFITSSKIGTTAASPMYNYTFFDPYKQYERLMDALAYATSGMKMRLHGVCSPPKCDAGILIYSDEDFISRALLEIFDYVSTHSADSPEVSIDFFILPWDMNSGQIEDIVTGSIGIPSVVANFSPSSSSIVIAIWRIRFAGNTGLLRNSLEHVDAILSPRTRQFATDSGITVYASDDKSSHYATITLELKPEIINCVDPSLSLRLKNDTKYYEEMCELKDFCASLVQPKNVHCLHIGTTVSDTAEAVFVYCSALGMAYKPLIIGERDMGPDNLIAVVDKTTKSLNRDIRKTPTVITIDEEYHVFNSLVQALPKLPSTLAVIYFVSIHSSSMLKISSLLQENSDSRFMCAVPKPLGPIKFYMTMMDACSSVSRQARPPLKSGLFCSTDRDSTPIQHSTSQQLPSAPQLYPDVRNTDQQNTFAQKDGSSLTPIRTCGTIPAGTAPPLEFISLDQVVPCPPQDASRPSNISLFCDEYHDIPKLATGIHALVVESDAVNRKIIVKVLKKMGLCVEAACNGTEAVCKYKSGRYHLVLMGLSLPVMDGAEAAREIRKYESSKRKGAAQYADIDSKDQECPYAIDAVIIAMICPTDHMDGNAIGRAGFSDFLIKPISLVHLERKVMEWGRMQIMVDYGYVFGEAMKRRASLLDGANQKMAQEPSA